MIMDKWYGTHPDLGLLLMRVALGAVFVMSGAAKFMAIAGTAKFFASLGLGIFWVYVVATVELLGGLAMLLGLGTTLAGWLLAIDMLVAIYLVKFSAGFTGYRLELTLLLVALGLAFTGAGKYALHRLFCRNCGATETKHS